MERIKQEIKDAKIYSPITGKIDYIADTEVGDYVQTYKTFVEISDQEKMMIQSDNVIFETLLTKRSRSGYGNEFFTTDNLESVNPSGIVAGMNVKVYYTTEKFFNGKIKSINKTQNLPSTVVTTGNNSNTAATPIDPTHLAVNFSVDLIEAPPSSLHLGSDVEIFINAGTFKDAIFVPTYAVKTFYDKKYVYIYISPTVSQQREVKTGYVDKVTNQVNITVV